MALAITRSRHGLGWLHGGLGAAALVGLVSCTGMEDQEANRLPGHEAPPGSHSSETAAASTPGAEASAQGKSDTAREALAYEPDELLVRFKTGTSLTASFAAHDQYRAQLVHAYRIPSNLHLVKLPSGQSVEKAIDRYRRDPNVLYAEPNYRYQLTAPPGDPRYAELWGMHNTGQTGGTADADINAPEAWDIITGSPDVVIGVLDTGLDYDHEDLAANAFVNPGEIPGNGVDDDGNGFVDDVHGINALNGSGDPMDELDHGTHVSGTIAARGDNDIGIAGVSWEAKIVACKAFSQFGGNLDNILQCMEYFLDLKTRSEHPVNIVATNNSWGGGGFSQALYDAIAAHRDAGILFVAAAGNSFGNDNDDNPFYPASYDLDNIISVLATDHNDERAEFSNMGARSVDVGAPGKDILSTTAGNNYAAFSGTSMATPHVTGLVALLKAQDPSRSPQAIKNLILTGGRETPGTRGTTLSGRSIRADGSLTCVDRVLTRRFAPSSDSVVVGLGNAVPLGVVSINCDRANAEPQTVTVSPGGQTISLEDGRGSGQFEAMFTPTDLGTYTLTFSSGDEITVSAIGNYDVPRPAPFDCQPIQGTHLSLGDDASAEVSSPFPIRFAGGEARDTFHVSSNGTISFSGPFSGFANQALPTRAVETLIAPFWDDLNPTAGGTISHAVRGRAPNREMVVEWRDVPHFPAIDAVTFQVVFFERSPNILFNYCDVTMGHEGLDRGASATIGVQVTGQVARQHSFNEASVSDGTSLLFTMGAPMAVAGGDQVVLPGAEVTLDGSNSRDMDGTIVSYAWTQIAGDPVALRNAEPSVVTFVAPERSGTLTFQLEVTDDSGQTGRDTVDVVINQAPVAHAGQDFELANGLPGALDATASHDPDGSLVGFRWTQLNGEPVALVGSETATPTFTAPATPQYLVFQLTVIDEHGFSDSDVVVVHVFRNAPPVAHAGEDRVVRPGSVITLDGSASMDPDGEIVRYAWEVTLCVTVNGLCELGLEASDTAAPRFAVPEMPGLVHLTLTVTDDAGATATASIVLGVFRQAPRAAIRGGEGCVSSGSQVTLDGMGSHDPDGTIERYQWTQLDGPAVALDGADTALASFVAPAHETTLRFALTVTDDDDLSNTAHIELPVGMPPVAVARASTMVAFTGTIVTLDAHQSRDATTYQWTQIAGPAVALSDTSAPSPTFEAPVPARSFELVTFALTVTSACGATATDRVSVLILAS